MYTKELNRDIKRLAERVKKLNPDGTDSDKYFQDVEEIKNEFRRLYDSDKKFEYVTLYSLKVLVLINRRFNCEPIHRFGIHAEL